MKWRSNRNNLEKKEKEEWISLKDRVRFLELIKETWTDPELHGLDKRVTLLEKVLVEVGLKVYEQPKLKKAGK